MDEENSCSVRGGQLLSSPQHTTGVQNLHLLSSASRICVSIATKLSRHSRFNHDVIQSSPPTLGLGSPWTLQEKVTGMPSKTL